VSLAQASRLLPALVDLGLIERREAPPSALFRFVPEHIAARAITALTRVRQTTLDELACTAATLIPLAISVIVFGSFARGDADAESDLDVIMVRSGDIDDDDALWRSAAETWRQKAQRLTGNRVEVIEVNEHEVRRLLHSGQPLWTDVQADGIVVFGTGLAGLTPGALPRQTRTRPVSSAQAGAYLVEGEEYLAAASSELEAGRAIAATSLAIHAAINAADAVTGLRMGRRAAGQDHDQVLALLREAGKDGAELETDLARLLALKTKAEYDPEDIPTAEASRAVERASRCVAVARRLG